MKGIHKHIYTSLSLGYPNRTDSFVRDQVPAHDQRPRRLLHRDPAKGKCLAVVHTQEPNTRQLILGLLVISELLFLYRFDIVDGFTFDYMHATLLGIVKLVTTLIFESTMSVDYNIRGRGESSDSVVKIFCCSE